MNDHLLVEALRERDADAPAALYDAHADRLYAYCWFQLRCRDAAQVALRDTFIVADAHIAKLRDPDRFGPWLYAIARLECARRPPTTDQAPDVPVASHDQEDVDQRIMAWHAVLSLPPLSREILELRVRQRLSVPDLAAVLEVSLKDAESALDRAHAELEEALAAEILAHQGPYGCAGRARLLRERRGGFDRDLNGRLMKHAQECSTCGAVGPRTVSAAKVYGLLPDAGPPTELRLRTMSYFLDPELVGYRLFVATRLTEFTADGFPVQSRQLARPFRRTSPARLARLRRFCRTGFRRRMTRSKEGVPGLTGLGAQAVRVAAVLTAMALVSACGVGFIFGLFGTGRRHTNTVASPRPTPAPGLSQHPDPGPPPADHPDIAEYFDAVPVSATFPLGARESSAPPTALPTPAPGSSSTDDRSGSAKSALEVSPLFLDLAGESDGSIDLRARGRPVSWSASYREPLWVNPAFGRLEAGQSVTVRVHVSRLPDSSGDGTVTLSPGGIQVRITWRPKAPGEPPTPSPTQTGTGPGNPSTPPGSHGPDDPPPSHSGPPSSDPPPSSGPPSSGSPPSSGDPDPTPSTPPPSPSAPARSGARTAAKP